MRIVRIFAELPQFLRLQFVFRHINSSKISFGDFNITWQPNRKSTENQAHFVPLSELSVPYLLCQSPRPLQLKDRGLWFEIAKYPGMSDDVLPGLCVKSNNVNQGEGSDYNRHTVRTKIRPFNHVNNNHQNFEDCTLKFCCAREIMQTHAAFSP